MKMKEKFYNAKDVAKYFGMHYTYIYANHIDSVDLKFPSKYEDYDTSILHYTDTKLTKILILYKRSIINFTQYLIQQKQKDVLVINNRGEKIKIPFNKIERKDLIVFNDFIEINNEIYIKETSEFKIDSLKTIYL